eukprot:Hpha_TRINITY_DN16702_c7_g4::TRINITY_DN16702_c7_g4_i1::g.76569::m.76569
MFEAPEGMSWGDVGLLTALDEEPSVGGGLGEGLNMEYLSRMLADGDESAKGILTFWLELNSDDPERLSSVFCPAHLETVHGVLALGSSPPRPIRLRSIPGGKLSDAAHDEATFLLRLKQMQLEYGGMLTKIFGDVAYTLPSGALSVIVADSRRRLLEALVNEPGTLDAAARHLSGTSVKAAGVSADFLEEMFRMARRCGESGHALHERCHHLQIPTKLFLLTTTPLRQRAAEALRAMAACGGIGAWCVKEAAAHTPQTLEALAAGTGESVGVEEELLLDVLRCIPRDDPFATVFASSVLPELVRKGVEGQGQPSWRLAAAWVKRGHGGSDEVGELMRQGATTVKAFCHPRSKADIAACTVLEIMRFALMAAHTRDEDVAMAVEDSGIIDAAVAIGAAAAPGAKVKRGGMLQEMGEKVTDAWLMRSEGGNPF